MAQNLELLDQIGDLLLGALPSGPRGKGRMLSENHLLLRPLGCGAMGAVFYGEDMALAVPVAVKILSPALTYNRQILDRFLQEARLLARISSPNVVRVWASGSIPEHRIYFFIMEYVDGAGVDELVRALKRPLDERAALALLARAARGLAAMHEQDLIHRDFKPGNLLWPRGSNEVKVCDLGMAKEETGTGLSLTGATDVIGTPLYMSPEQARGSKHVDARADVYSLGATFYYLLTGRAPVGGKGLSETLTNVATGNLIDVREHREDVSDFSHDLLARLLAFEAEDRPADATEVEAMLIEQLGEELETDTGIHAAFGAIDIDHESSETMLAERFAAAETAFTSGAPTGGDGATMIVHDEGLSALAAQATIIRNEDGTVVTGERQQAARAGGAPPHRPAEKRRGPATGILLRTLLYLLVIVGAGAMGMKHLNQERARLHEESFFEACFAEHSPMSLRRYLDRFPDGAHRAEIENAITALESAARVDEDAWRQSRAADTIEALEDYLRRFPGGVGVGETRIRLDLLIADRDDHAAVALVAARAEAEGDHDIAAAAYGGYLERHPNGRHVATAAAERARLNTAHEQATRDDGAYATAQAEASGASTPREIVTAMRALQRYLDTYPGGRHTQEARAARQNLQTRARAEGEEPYWSRVGDQVTAAVASETYTEAIGELETYAEIYAGDGAHLEEATARIGQLHARQQRLEAAQAALASIAEQAQAAVLAGDYPRAIELYRDLVESHTGAGRLIEDAVDTLERWRSEWARLQSARVFETARGRAETAGRAADHDTAIRAYEEALQMLPADAAETPRAREELARWTTTRERDLHDRATREGAPLRSRIAAARRYVEIGGPQLSQIRPLLTRLEELAVSLSILPCWVCGADNLRNHALCRNCGECILRFERDPEGWQYRWDASGRLVERRRGNVVQRPHYEGATLTDLIDQGSEQRISYVYERPGIAGSRLEQRNIRMLEYRLSLSYTYDGDRLKSVRGRAASLDPIFDEGPTPSGSGTYTYTGNRMTASSYEQSLGSKVQVSRKLTFSYSAENVTGGEWRSSQAEGGAIKIRYSAGAASGLEVAPSFSTQLSAVRGRSP